MSAYYFYSSIIAFLVGTAVAALFSITFPVLLWTALMAIVCWLFWYRSKFTFVTSSSWLTMSVLIFSFTLGAWWTELYENRFGDSDLATQVGEKITLDGIVVREPDQREKFSNLYIRVDEDLILVSVDRYVPIAYGDEVKVTGVLKIPETFTTEFDRTFNYPGYLLAKGVEYQISFAEIEILDSGLGNTFISKLLIFKVAFMDGLENVIPEPAVGLGEGLLLGVKQALGDELEDAFRETGIIHIVVLSGYNVMLVVAFVMFVLGYFLSIRLRVVAGIMAIISFALLVGLSATVVRASIMASLLLVAQATGRMYLALRGLLGAGLIMVIFNPYLLLYDVGFQLSFLATLGLILLAPLLEKAFSLVPSFAGLRLFLVATIATQIAVLPLLLYQIGQFSVVSVMVNVLVLPMVPIAMLLTFSTGMLALLSTKLALLLAYPTYWSLSYINNLALWFADLYFAAFVVPTFSFYIVPVSYLALGLIIWYGYRNSQVTLGQSEIGENLLRLNRKEILAAAVAAAKNKDLKGKIINRKGSGASRPTPPEDLPKEDIPIFFR